MVKQTETYTEKEQERIDAINRHQRGERPLKICKGPGRSKSWLQKWEKLWEREQWTDLVHIRSEAKTFLMRYNNRQDWKYQKTDLRLYRTVNFQRISR